MIRISETSRLGRVLLSAGAALVALTLAVQLHLAIAVVVGLGKSAAFGVAVFLSFFTIVTNIWLVAVLVSSLARPDAKHWMAAPAAKAALVVSLAMVGLGYALVFRRYWHPTGAQWVVDGILHYVVPLLAIAYWIFFVPKGHLRWRHAALWMLYPMIYFTLSLALSAVTGFYPYPFLDAGKLGYPQALAVGWALQAVFWVLGLMIVAADRKLRHRQYRLL